MTRKGSSWTIATAVGVLALVGIAAAATHYLWEPYNPGFLDFPIVTALHVVLGGTYLVLAPLQFVRRIRSRHLAYHRRVGRLLVAIGLVVGATALFMGLVIPFFGWGERVIIGLFGTVFLVALSMGFLHIRAGRVALHREWMVRAFAVGLSIATQRLIFFPALLIVDAEPTDVQFAALWVAAFVAAFVLNLSVAEARIRATRRSRVPRATTPGSA
jgi:uncharacterized membrane protein